MMTNLETHYFSFEELCDITELSSSIIIEAIEHGIIEPAGAGPKNWTFDTQMVIVAKKASRLHQDLGIDWSGIGLAIHLLDELEQLRIENELLKSRLNRFVLN